MKKHILFIFLYGVLLSTTAFTSELYYKNPKFLSSLESVKDFKTIQNSILIISALNTNPELRNDLLSLLEKYKVNSDINFSQITLEKNAVLNEGQHSGITIGNESDLTLYYQGEKLVLSDKKSFKNNFELILKKFSSAKKHSSLKDYLIPKAQAQDAVGASPEKAELVRKNPLAASFSILFANGLERMRNSIPFLKSDNSEKKIDEGFVYWKGLGSLSYQCDESKLKLTMLSHPPKNEKETQIEQYELTPNNEGLTLAKYISGIDDSGLESGSLRTMSSTISGKKYSLDKDSEKKWSDKEIRKMYAGLYELYSYCVNGGTDKSIKEKYDKLFADYNGALTAMPSTEKQLQLKKTLPGMNSSNK